MKVRISPSILQTEIIDCSLKMKSDTKRQHIKRVCRPASIYVGMKRNHHTFHLYEVALVIYEQRRNTPKIMIFAKWSITMHSIAKYLTMQVGYSKKHILRGLKNTFKNSKSTRESECAVLLILLLLLFLRVRFQHLRWRLVITAQKWFLLLKTYPEQK